MTENLCRKSTTWGVTPTTRVNAQAREAVAK
ncbi:hypothetical protein QFZ32_004130 [Streptomyces canus]|uniref:Uncharacterized protein n=1 Tax=Streptomyces canus TaxID=58343 RepID=A0AAW8FEX9_9ACTN|nr:hypothetical protein [Streptomyces canus]MDQ0908691.1 hypothetical protein [Streptomyces canus]MDQ1068690.1 hypothetical protein [Streptomyces canus]